VASFVQKRSIMYRDIASREAVVDGRPDATGKHIASRRLVLAKAQKWTFCDSLDRI